MIISYTFKTYNSLCFTFMYIEYKRCSIQYQGQIAYDFNSKYIC